MWVKPVGVSREDVKRPNGMSLIPWEDGRSLLWYFTLWLPAIESKLLLAPVWLPAQPSHSANILPTSIETMGAWGEGTKDIIQKI